MTSPTNIISEVYMFAKNTKLYKVVKEREDDVALQSYLDKLDKRSNEWLLGLNLDKYKVLNIGKTKVADNAMHLYGNYSNHTKVILQPRNCDNEKDNKLFLKNHIREKVTKANQMMSLIRRSFSYLDVGISVQIHCTPSSRICRTSLVFLRKGGHQEN